MTRAALVAVIGLLSTDVVVAAESADSAMVMTIAGDTIVEAFWRREFSAMKQSGLIPTAPPAAVAVGDWSGAAYEIALPDFVKEGVNTHIRAELIKAGTWVDLHISITSQKPLADARSEALEFLKSIVVNEKN